MRGWIQASIVLLVLMAAPSLAYSRELGHTIQLGSYLLEQDSKRQYRSVLEILQEEESDSLRIEKIGKYYALRLGAFKTFSGAKNLLKTIKANYPDAIIMKVYLDNDWLDPVDSSVVAAIAAPDSLEAKVKPSMIPAKKNAGPPQDLGKKAAATSEGFRPLIPDSLLISFVAVIFILMSALYIRELLRIKRAVSGQEQLTGAVDAAESNAEKENEAAEEEEHLSVASAMEGIKSQDAESLSSTAVDSVECDKVALVGGPVVAAATAWESSKFAENESGKIPSHDLAEGNEESPQTAEASATKFTDEKSVDRNQSIPIEEKQEKRGRSVLEAALLMTENKR